MTLVVNLVLTPSRVRNRVAWFVWLLLLPSPGWAQWVESFEKIALLVNLDDHVQVQEQSGAVYTGRLTRLSRREIVVETPAGEKRLTSDAVGTVALRGHRLRAGALIGAASVAALGSVATCAHEGGSDCAVVGALRAAPIGAGVGLVIGSFIPQMRRVYVAPGGRLAAPPSRISPDEPASLLDDLALHVNLNDRLTVEDQSGNWTSGRLSDVTADQLTIHTAAGERRFTRAQLRHVRVRRQHLRSGTLIGAGIGSIYGALSWCGGPDADCPDGVIIGTALGAGAGVLVAALLNNTTVVYQERDKRTFIAPQLSRSAFAITVTRLW